MDGIDLVGSPEFNVLPLDFCILGYQQDLCNPLLSLYSHNTGETRSRLSALPLSENRSKNPIKSNRYLTTGRPL